VLTLNKRTKRYLQAGRNEARQLFPVPDEMCRCGQAKVSDIHHIDGNTYHNDAENIAFYCHKCRLRIERQNGRVGKHTKLTKEQIDRIRTQGERIGKLSAEFDYDPAGLQKIRNGKRIPIPYNEIAVPDNWVDNDVTGKHVRFSKQALSVKQVKELTSYMMLKKKKAQEYADKWNVAVSTIYKAKGRQGGYAHPRFD